MYGTASLCYLFLGGIAALGQADAASKHKDVQLGVLGSGSGDMIAAVGQNKRTLQSSTIQSFDITITFVNSINLAEGTTIDITFDGSSGPVGTVTVTAPASGETAFFDFCLDAAGETDITSGSDMDDTVLIVDIDPNVCPCGVDVCFDPHLQGLRGQHIEWTGVDGGWYALVNDDEDDLQINVRTTAPLPNDFPDRQFITGVAILSQGHSLVVEVKEPYTVDTHGCSNDVSPCLADGGLTVSVDGELVDHLTGPTNDVHLPGDIEVSSSNLPPACREFGGRKVWARMQKDMLRGRRHLSAAKTFEDWVLSFTHMVAPEFCATFVANSDLSKVQSDQALLRIATPTAVVRLSVGINHRRAGKTDRFGRDLPELDFWQMGVGVEGLNLNHESLSGLLGNTARVVLDAEGNKVMEGTDALPGKIIDYRVSDAEGTDFPLLHN
ncbi:unnamed protein product [Ascophyllum nodosum]